MINFVAEWSLGKYEDNNYQIRPSWKSSWMSAGKGFIGVLKTGLRLMFHVFIFSNVFKYLNIKYFMYLIDHVAELRFVNRLIYAIKRTHTHTHTNAIQTASMRSVTPLSCL